MMSPTRRNSSGINLSYRADRKKGVVAAVLITGEHDRLSHAGIIAYGNI